MLSVQLELVVLCRGCEAPVALNAVVPSIRCDRCQRAATFADADWREILDGALAEAGRMADNEERDLPFDGAPGRIRRIVRRCSPRCSACRTGFPAGATALADGEALACAGCGRVAHARRLQAFADVGFFGEDRGVLDGETLRAAPVMLDCGKCAASLTVDGTDRVVTCKYCGASQHLPDAVWARLHPLRPVAPFYALFAVEDSPAVHAGAFEWRGVTDMVADATGNLYLCGYAPIVGAGDGFGTVDHMVCSLDPQLALRWLRRDERAERLALFGDRLLIWDGCEPTLLACDDGRTLAETFPLDGHDVRRFYLDRDGTIIRASLTQVTRHAPNGDCIERHPAKPTGWLAQIAGVFKGDLLAERLWGLTGALLPDGAIAGIWSDRTGDNDGVTVVALDGPTGETRFKHRVKVDHSSLHAGRLHGDGRGGVLFLDHEGRQILRVDAEGVTVVMAGGFLDRNSRMAVLANDEMWILSDDGVARRLAPDGRLLYASEGARRQDREVALGRNHGDNDDENNDDDDDDD